MEQICLAAPDDFDGWRTAARSLLHRAVPPQQVGWHVVGPATDTAGPALFEAHGPGEAPAPARDQATAVCRVPAGLVEQLREAACHSEPRRWALMYRLLWRWTHDEPVRRDPLDPDRLEVARLQREVRRDIHKTRAFVRFTPLETPDGARYVAWFEPRHHTVRTVAPFFARRFASLHWALLTPKGCAQWDGRVLQFGGPAERPRRDGDDPVEALWLTYYRHVFNPARPKLAALQKEMPRRYWPGLPEARLIAPLLRDAGARTQAMVDAQTAADGPGARRAQRRAQRLAAISTLPGAGCMASSDGPAGSGPSIAAAAEAATPPGASRAALQACRRCPHAALATQAVPGTGPTPARLMIVGEQPGDLEDLHGEPFVGPAGQLLDRALRDLRLDRQRLYLTNAVKHFRFETRGRQRLHKSPGQREVETCREWLDEELRQVRPQVVLALGVTAARSLLGPAVGALGEWRGRWCPGPHGIQVRVTWHPAALLRLPPAAWPAAYEAWRADIASAAVAAGEGAGGCCEPSGGAAEAAASRPQSIQSSPNTSTG